MLPKLLVKAEVDSLTHLFTKPFNKPLLSAAVGREHQARGPGVKEPGILGDSSSRASGTWASGMR